MGLLKAWTTGADTHHELSTATSYASPESMAEDRVDALEDKVKWLNFRQWITAASVLLIGIILFIIERY